MMTSSPIEDLREGFISDICNLLEDENFVKESTSEKAKNGFSRKRKLTFNYLIILITQGLSRSLQRELNSFYQKIKNTNFSIQEVTKSAFTHARAKLNPEAFIKLNKRGIESFYERAPYLKWKGYRLLGIDGSSLMLPNHPSVLKEFGLSPGKLKPMARISMLYDLLNFTTLDAQIDTYGKYDIELGQKHLPCVTPGSDLLIMDRGYASVPLMQELEEKGIHFLIRMKDNWWIEVREMQEKGETDKIITFKKGNSTATARLVIVPIPGGETEVLCTSLLDLPFEDFSDLYHYRWNIEEGYKLYKNRIQLEDFSGKTAHAIKQDFFAKVFMMTTTAVLAFPIEEKLKKEQEQSTKKYTYKVNRTNALSLAKEITPFVFIMKKIKCAIQAFDKILRETLEAVRPNRKNPRRKTPKKPPSMNYKQL